MNEFKLAYDAASIEHGIRRWDKVETALKYAPYVVVVEVIAYCPYTDAILPNGNFAVFAKAHSEADANAAYFDCRMNLDPHDDVIDVRVIKRKEVEDANDR